jgi:DNA-binding transcriptional LysR family regulator
LTEAGQTYYEHCAAVVTEAMAAQESVERLRAEPSGTVRLSCHTVLAQYYVSTLLPDFMTLNPKVRLVMEVSDRPVRLVEERIDIALRVCRGFLDDPGVVARTLAVTRMVLVASPGYVECHGPPSSPDALPTLDTISCWRDGSEGEQVWHLHGPDSQTVAVTHLPKLFCPDLIVQHEAALRGTGIALIPEPIVGEALANKSLVRVLPNWSSADEIIQATFTSRRGMLPSVRALLDYLVVHLPIALRL